MKIFVYCASYKVPYIVLLNWTVRSKYRLDFSEGHGIAVREYQTGVGPADYVLFVDKQAVGVVLAKPEEWGRNITTVEPQSGTCAAAELSWVNNQEPLPLANNPDSRTLSPDGKKSEYP